VSENETCQMSNHFIRDAARISPNPRRINLHTPVEPTGRFGRSCTGSARCGAGWRCTGHRTAG
jgi:hypothetical protein